MFAVWILFFVPIIISGLTWYFYNHKVTWWELILPTLATTLLIWIGNSIEEKVLISDVEYVNGFVTEVKYYEDWNEKVSCRHPKYCTRTTTCGSGKNRRTCTERYQCGWQHAYDVDYHPERWEAVNTFGYSFSISSDRYKKLIKQFNNETFKDLRRNYHTNDGDMYFSVWDKKKATAEPFTRTQSYDNRVQASHSLFNFPDISEEDVKAHGLIDYPEFVNGYQQNYVIGVKDEAIQKEFRYLNSFYGKKKQVVVWVLVVQGKPRDWAYLQEAYWDGGNKNEATAIVNLHKDGTVDWVYVMSWTEREDFKVKMKSAFPQDEKLDLYKANTLISDAIAKRWVRKSFHDFDYIQIEFPTWYIVMMYVLVITGNAFLAVWIVKNEF